MKFFMKGVQLRDPRLTRDWRVWSQYLCWCIATIMSDHKPILPIRVRLWAYQRWPDRVHLTWRMYHWWIDGLGADPKTLKKPLSWPLGEAAFGPFVGPWNRVSRWFRNHTGGRSHRCEFTDPKIGALYGGQRGAFMNELFEQFIENISV